MLSTLALVTGLVAVALVVCHLALNRRLGRRPGFDEGRASVKGGCGDTVEMRLRFEGGRAVDAACRTDGCAHSLLCLRSAADLARGRRPDEILALGADDVARAMGGLPADDRHCAQLAAEALHAAASAYRDRSV